MPRNRLVGEFPPVTSQYRPADYVDERNRGTIEYNPSWNNYSFHTIEIPGDGVFEDCNFSQAEPGTNCFVTVTEGLPTFINCNLVNAATNDIWNTQECNSNSVEGVGI